MGITEMLVSFLFSSRFIGKLLRHRVCQDLP